MTEPESQLENKTKNIKLYSSKAVTGATFLGGPLAAGYLISENFKALNKPNEGRRSLIIGIIATIALFTGMFMIPESIMDKMPRQLIPLIYTGIIWGIVEWKQGNELKTHKENGNLFFSGWKAAGIGLISLLVMGAGIFGYAYIESNNPAYEIYEKKITEFSKNETESLTFYNNIHSKDNSTLLNELNNDVIPKWEKNIRIIKESNSIDGLPSDLLNQNKILLKYSELRLQTLLLMKKGIIEDTDKYNEQLNLLELKINAELDKLN